MKQTLTESEIMMAYIIGGRRQSASKMMRNKHGYVGSGWDIHIEGAAGEIAVAKALNVYWGMTVNQFKVGGDVGRLQVRTRSKSNYDLIIRDDDRDEDIFILVIGQVPTFEIMGWIRAKDGKRQDWRKSHGGREPAYFIPQNELNDVETLN